MTYEVERKYSGARIVGPVEIELHPDYKPERDGPSIKRIVDMTRKSLSNFLENPDHPVIVTQESKDVNS